MARVQLLCALTLGTLLVLGADAKLAGW